ncbi:hypothetical protein POTOM_005704 [Populus tomentosa]|uniref:Uncharacterized protein n=1 Tax=Populus tomentosa TaxID=118781 RepID=A0A8X8AHL4_POPTO|nr:hypothetical protein POTOM_005704 [Populus tomentosa]
MAFGVRLCLCLLLVFAVISSARNTISFSAMKVLKEARFSVATLKGPVCSVKCGDAYNEMALAIKGRSLKTTLNDYGDPVANRGHDPSQRNKNWGGGGGGRKG